LVVSLKRTLSGGEAYEKAPELNISYILFPFDCWEGVFSAFICSYVYRSD